MNLLSDLNVGILPVWVFGKRANLQKMTTSVLVKEKNYTSKYIILTDRIANAASSAIAHRPCAPP